MGILGLKRSGKRLIADWLSIAIMLGLLVVVAKYQIDENATIGVPVVVDGDTIRLAGKSVRLIGMDAPEMRQTCSIGGSDFACGKAASRHLEKLVSGHTVDCQGWRYDIYERLLAECRISNAPSAQASLNRQMVEDGWAISWHDYGAEEKRARKAGRGLWQSEFIEPSVWRRNNGAKGEGEIDLVASIWNWLIGLMPR